MSQAELQFIFFMCEIQLIPNALLASQIVMRVKEENIGAVFINYKVLYKCNVTVILIIMMFVWEFIILKKKQKANFCQCEF